MILQLVIQPSAWLNKSTEINYIQTVKCKWVRATYAPVQLFFFKFYLNLYIYSIINIHQGENEHLALNRIKASINIINESIVSIGYI